MSTMDRREFIRKTTAAVATALGTPVLGADKVQVAAPPATRPVAKKLLRAGDTVTLAKTKIKTSRLAIGTGTLGGREQRDVGIEGMIKLFRHGLDQGVRWWESAEMYRTHPHVAAALKEVKRDRVVITTKTRSQDAAGVRKDIEDFRKELGSDYIDIVLLHGMRDHDWREKMKGPMDALSEAKDKGLIRAVGCSYHTLSALQAGADEPWTEVNLVRINPFALRMDVEKIQELPKVEKVLQTMHQRGKAAYGMKILAQGDLKGDRIDKSLRFVLARPYVSAFTIGFSRNEQIDDIIRRIDRIRATA